MFEGNQNELYSNNEIYPKVVFESNDGVRSVIAVEKLDYPNFSEGSCIVIKWDSYEDTDVYEIIFFEPVYTTHCLDAARNSQEIVI